LWFDPIKMAAYGITVGDVRNALQSQNVELPTGKLVGENTELTIKTLGNLSTEEEFNKIIIKTEGDKIVRFSDVGFARLESENLETKMVSNGKQLVGIAVVPQPGTNYIEIADSFCEIFDHLQEEVPEDISLNIAEDNTL